MKWMRLLLFLLLVTLIQVPLPTCAQNAADEYEVKAAYLFKMSQSYITWPRSPKGVDDGTFAIGVLGKDPFGSALDQLKDREIARRKVVIHRYANLQEYKPCHILFLANGDDTLKTLSAYFESAQGEPTLIVADTKGMATKGAMLNLLLVNDRVVFEINHEAAKDVGLKFDSRLLQVGRVVNTEK